MPDPVHRSLIRTLSPSRKAEAPLPGVGKLHIKQKCSAILSSYVVDRLRRGIVSRKLSIPGAGGSLLLLSRSNSTSATLHFETLSRTAPHFFPLRELSV